MDRADHWEEAARLLERAKELTAEYVNIDSAATQKKVDLEMLHRQLTTRAHGHAALASAPMDVWQAVSQRQAERDRVELEKVMA